jgi:hypothetical protein
LPDPATSFANSRYFRPVSPKETRIHKWDQEFESAFLHRRVQCEPHCFGISKRTPSSAVGTMARQVIMQPASKSKRTRAVTG